MRRAARRDNNESPLIELAELLGWWLIKLDEPCDWLGWRRGQWHAIEIKNPDKEGHADEFTSRQLLFLTEARKRGAEVMVWRTSDDVLKASNARKSA